MTRAHKSVAERSKTCTSENSETFRSAGNVIYKGTREGFEDLNMENQSYNGAEPKNNTSNGQEEECVLGLGVSARRACTSANSEMFSSAGNSMYKVKQEPYTDMENQSDNAAEPKNNTSNDEEEECGLGLGGSVNMECDGGMIPTNTQLARNHDELMNTSDRVSKLHPEQHQQKHQQQQVRSYFRV